MENTKKTFVKFITVILCSLLIVINFAGISAHADDTIVYYPNGNVTAVVTASDVCFRRHASTSSEIIDILQNGDSAKFLGGTAGNEWSKVSYNGVTGFIYSNYLKYIKN